MSIERIGQNLWAVKVVVRVPGVPNPVTRREKFAGTKVEAECRKAEIINQLKSNCSSLTLQEGVKNFSEAVGLYVDNLQATGKLSPTHRDMIERIRREFGDMPLRHVPDRLMEYRRVLVQTRKSNALVNRHTAIIRAVFNRLVALEMLPKNPITAVRFPKFEEKARDRYLTEQERSRLLDAIREHRPFILPIVQYMLSVPCRVSELTSALREQYNPFTRTIYIPDSKAGIPIHKPVPAEMVEYFEGIPEDCPWLFYQETAKGKYRPLTHLRYAWEVCRDKADLCDLRIHDLRGYSATGLLEAGNSEREVMSVAGWQTNMLSTYYRKDSLKSAQTIKFKNAS